MKDDHIPTLDGIRAIAFLLVYLAHAGFEKAIPGGLGVTTFFFLSGYLITTLLRREAEKTHTISLRDFYVRRAFRILPPMFTTLIVADLLAIAGLVAYRANALGIVSVVAYFYNYAYLLHWKAILPTGMEVLWSLMVEEHFYLFFPLLYLSFIRHKFSPARQSAILWSICIAAFIWRCCLVYFFHTKLFLGWTYSASDARFDSILFGCILAIRDNVWLGDVSPWLHRFRSLAGCCGLVLLVASLAVREPHFRETLRYSIQGVSLYLIFYSCLASPGRWQVRWLDWKPLRWLGWVSYAMYLSHLVVFAILLRLFPDHWIGVPVFSFGIAAGYSWLIRRYIEGPSRRLRSRWLVWTRSRPRLSGP